MFVSKRARTRGKNDTEVPKKDQRASFQEETSFLQLQQPHNHQCSTISNPFLDTAEKRRGHSYTFPGLLVLFWCVGDIVRSLLLCLSRKALQTVSGSLFLS